LPLGLRRIISDFGKAIINAAGEQFPGIEHQGCLFHFAQAIYRKVQELGFATAYRSDEQFRKNVRLFVALGMVPAQQKYAYFLEIPKQDPRIAQLAQYFYNTWFCQYDPTVWDFFAKDRRTNNAVEAWHSRIKRFFKIKLLNFYRFGNVMLQEAKKVDKDLNLRLVGANVPRRKLVYDAIDQRFANLFEEFHMRCPMDYLTGFLYALPEPRGY
jgi:hypothetical protein